MTNTGYTHIKKSFSYILIMIFITCLSTACTHFQGPSGDLYGRWHLERIEADNMEAPQQSGDLYWSFQTQVIYMQCDKGEHEFAQAYGIFRLEDNTLFLDFPENTPALAQTGLGRQNTLQVLKITGKELTLLYNPTPDSSLTYYLRKG